MRRLSIARELVFLNSLVNSDGCLSSLRVNNHQKEILKHHSRVTGLDMHGPAVNMVRDSIPGFASYDHVTALKSDAWPEDILFDIGQLRSKLNFLTPEQIDEVLQLPCLFVPVPHSSDKDNEYVWRLSFSQHELMIFQSLPLVCKRTYFMCKDIVKSASELNESLKILKSNYLKTTLFPSMLDRESGKLGRLRAYQSCSGFTQSLLIIRLSGQLLHCVAEPHSTFISM